MRIRSVKPDYWAHEMHGAISLLAGMLGAALNCFADDEGRFKAQPQAIKGQLCTFWQASQEQIVGAMAELEGVGYLRIYQAKGFPMPIGQILNWRDSQVINKARASLLPAPPLEPDGSQQRTFPESILQPAGQLPDDYRNNTGVVTSDKKHEALQPAGQLPDDYRNNTGVVTSDKKHEALQPAGQLPDDYRGKEGRRGVEGGRESARGRDGETPAPSLSEVLKHAEKKGVGTKCARKFFLKMEGEGWIGANGQRVAKWQALLEAWAETWAEFEGKKTGPTAEGEMAELEARLDAATDPEERRKLREQLRQRAA